MSEQPVIAARGLTKSYRIWEDPSARLLGPIWAEAAGWLPGKLGDALRTHAARGVPGRRVVPQLPARIARAACVATAS